MANYFLTETAQFKPFSYQEMLAPVKGYVDAYNKAEDDLDTLMADADATSLYFLSQDTREKQIYDNLMNDLEKASDNLSSGDIKAFSDIRDIRRDYIRKITPIKAKLVKRQELINEQNKLRQSNPYIRFTTDYSNSNLDDIDNASTYNVLDLNTIKDNAGKAFLDYIKSNGIVQLSPKKIRGTDYYRVGQGYGYTNDTFLADLQKGEQGNINKWLKDYLGSLNLQGHSDKVIKEVKDSILTGVINNKGVFEYENIKGTTAKDNNIFAFRDKNGAITYKRKIGNKLYDINNDGTIAVGSGQSITSGDSESKKGDKKYFKFKGETMTTSNDLKQLTGSEVARTSTTTKGKETTTTTYSPEFKEGTGVLYHQDVLPLNIDYNKHYSKITNSLKNELGDDDLEDIYDITFEGYDDPAKTMPIYSITKKSNNNPTVEEKKDIEVDRDAY